MFKDFIKKSDIILLAVLVVIGLISSFALSFGRNGGDRVEIKSGNKLYGTYSLRRDRTVTVHRGSQYNTVKIHGGKVRVISASCKNQICVEHHAISKSGESIICLPNKLVVRITGGGEGYDAVSN